MNEQNKRLNARIKAAYGSQSAFARKLGVTRALVSGKLNGRFRYTKRDVIRWGSLLDIKPEEFRAWFPGYFEDVERMTEF